MSDEVVTDLKTIQELEREFREIICGDYTKRGDYPQNLTKLENILSNLSKKQISDLIIEFRWGSYHVEHLKIFIEHGINNTEYRDPLNVIFYRACRLNNYKVVCYLLEEFEIDFDFKIKDYGIDFKKISHGRAIDRALIWFLMYDMNDVNDIYDQHAIKILLEKGAKIIEDHIELIMPHRLVFLIREGFVDKKVALRKVFKNLLNEDGGIYFLEFLLDEGIDWENGLRTLISEEKDKQY